MVKDTGILLESGVVRVIETRVPHLSNRAIFVYPSAGPDTYQNVGKQILYIRVDGELRESGLVVPMGDISASLIEVAYFPKNDNPELANIREVMKARWLLVFQKNLWSPEGVYVSHDLEAKGLSEALDVSQLELAIRDGKEIAKGVVISQDGRVRFASKDSYTLWQDEGSYAFQDHTPESLTTDGFVVASYGIEGAKKLARVSTKFRNSPRTYGVNVAKGKSNVLRVSALYDHDFYGNGLVVCGNYRGNNNIGCAFALFTNTEDA